MLNANSLLNFGHHAYGRQHWNSLSHSPPSLANSPCLLTRHRADLTNAHCSRRARQVPHRILSAVSGRSGPSQEQITVQDSVRGQAPHSRWPTQTTARHYSGILNHWSLRRLAKEYQIRYIVELELSLNFAAGRAGRGREAVGGGS